MAVTDRTTTGVQYLLSTYYDKQFLTRLHKNWVLYPFGRKTQLPKGEGK